MRLKDKLLRALLGRHHEKLYWRKIYKNKEYINNKLDDLGLKSGDVVLDLGANIGLFSECCLDRGARVYAFEPNPLAAAELIRRIGDNPNLVFRPSAVSNKNCKMKLYFHKHHATHPLHMSESSSLFGDKVNVSGDHQEVDCIGIDDVLRPLDHIRLIKVDVEGAEYDLTEGIIKNLGKIDQVVMETHAARIPSLAKRHEELVARVDADPVLKQKMLLDWM